MQSPGSAAVGEVTADDLRRAVADLSAAEHHLAKAVVALGRIAGSGVCERVEGLPLELFIGLACRLTGADRNMLIGAGQTLRHLPATAQLFVDGAISWGQVRRIVAAAKRLRVAERAVLDARIAASVDQYGSADVYGPDDLCDAVDAAADELRPPTSVDRREQAAHQTNYLQVQRSLFDRVQLYADLDAATAAPIINALDAAAGAPAGCNSDTEQAERAAGDDTTGDHGGGSGDAAGEADGVPGDGPVVTRRGRHYAQALADIAAAYLGGGPHRPARPSALVMFDTADVHINTAGQLICNVRGPISRLTLAGLEALARDADVRAVLVDGKRPLTVTAKLRAADIPTDVRIAVAARDKGCRFPASVDPLGHSEPHHTPHRADGGTHHIDQLVTLSRRRHTLTHHHGWHLTIDPPTGTVTATRGKRTWRSLPRGTPLARPADTRPPPQAQRRPHTETPPPTTHRRRATRPCPSDLVGYLISSSFSRTA
ncbi:MAG TPA: hypothetical protein VM307_11590 [Egibacteraceae bacterium]|nr:hypothetical protein [Egibacteraceae bacterium]